MDRALEAIQVICKWYTDLPKGYSSINELIYRKQKLVGYLFFFTNTYELTNGNEAELLAEYEVKRNILRAGNLDSGVTKAEYLSKAKTATLKRDWIKAKSINDTVKSRMRQANKVCEAMTQHIAFLRKERETSKGQV